MTSRLWTVKWLTFFYSVACSLVIKHVTILLSANNLKLRRTTQQKNVLMAGSRKPWPWAAEPFLEAVTLQKSPPHFFKSPRISIHAQWPRNSHYLRASVVFMSLVSHDWTVFAKSSREAMTRQGSLLLLLHMQPSLFRTCYGDTNILNTVHCICKWTVVVGYNNCDLFCFFGFWSHFLRF